MIPKNFFLVLNKLYVSSLIYQLLNLVSSQFGKNELPWRPRQVLADLDSPVISLPNGNMCDELRPGLSVVVPAYNVENYIIDCLQSITSQSIDVPIEVIVVDDGSTDNTGEFIDDFAVQHSCISVIHQKNRGLSGARNSGLAVAQREYVAFIDSDDVLPRNALQSLLDAFDPDQYDYISGLWSSMSENGTNIKLAETTRTHGAPWGRIYKRRIWDDISFPEGLWFEDSVQEYCVATRYREQLLARSVYNRRQRSTSITHVATKNYKSLDSYWIVEEMLQWCKQLHIPFNQHLYELTVRQFGPLLYWRTLFLNDVQRRALFACCCDLLASYKEFDEYAVQGSDAFMALEHSLRSRNYQLWERVCLLRKNADYSLSI